MDAIRLSDRNLADLLDAAARCGGGRPAGRRDVERVLGAVAALVTCDVAFWTWYRLPPQPVDQVLVTVPRMPEPEPEPASPGPGVERPNGPPAGAGRRGPPMIDDVLGGRVPRRSWLQHEALVPAGEVSEMGMELSHDADEMSVVVLARERGRPFDSRDRLVLRLLRPHVDAALRRLTHRRPAVTPRELEVLGLVRDGLTNAQVARRLGIAEATVAKHLEHVFAHTGARSRTQAVALCVDLIDAG